MLWSGGLLQTRLQTLHLNPSLAIHQKGLCCRPHVQGQQNVLLHVLSKVMPTLSSALLSPTHCRRSVAAFACTGIHFKHHCHPGAGLKRIQSSVCCTLRLGMMHTNDYTGLSHVSLGTYLIF